MPSPSPALFSAAEFSELLIPLQRKQRIYNNIKPAVKVSMYIDAMMNRNLKTKLTFLAQIQTWHNSLINELFSGPSKHKTPCQR